MLRKAILAVAAVLATAAPAFAQTAQKDGPYAALSAGYLQFRDAEGTVQGLGVKGEYEPGYLVNGAFGYKWGALRGELELGYGRSGFDQINVAGTRANVDSDIDLFTATLNAYYDINTGTAFTPYLGAGIGLAHSSFDDATVTVGAATARVEGDSATDLLLQGEVGVSYALGQNVSIVPAYRFMWIDNGGNGLDDTSAHLFKIGVRYAF